MSQYSFMIDNMTWSYTRLSSFSQCPYEWYLQYIENCSGDNNFYAEFGKYCHVILEKYANGELGLFDLVDYYEAHFDENVGVDVRDSSGERRTKYFDLGKSYFENIDIDFDSYEILGVELKCDFKIDKYPFIGFIDLLLKEKKTGDIILIDHKSSEYPMGKRGKILKSEQEKFKGYKRQLYLYCIQVYNDYGVFPKKIGWNYFKAQQWLFVNFDEKEFEEAKQWALGVIGEINEAEEFPPNQDFFYCMNLCRFRNQYCEYKR